MSDKLSILFLKKGDVWLAQCLQYDIATQAETLRDCMYEMRMALIFHLTMAADQGRDPFEGLPPAPRELWECFDRAQKVTPENHEPVELIEGIPQAFMLERDNFEIGVY